MNEKHISFETLKNLKENKLNFEQKLAVLEHLSECEKCSEEYAEIFNPSELITVEYDVKIPAKNPNVRKTPSTVIYNLKVAIATLAAVMIVLFMPLTNADNQSKQSFELFHKYDEIFTVFSNKMNTFEVKK